MILLQEIVDGIFSAAIMLDVCLCRYGLRGRELVQTVGKTMLQGGGTFGVFMGIGTGIRC